MCPMQQICSPKKNTEKPRNKQPRESPKAILIKLCFQSERVHTVAQKRVFICTQLGFVHALYKSVYFFFFFLFFKIFFFTFTNKTYKMWSHLKFHRISFLYIENHHHNKLLIHEMESGVWGGICPGSLKYWWPGSEKKKENRYEQARQTLERGRRQRLCNPKRQEGKCMSTKALFQNTVPSPLQCK